MLYVKLNFHTPYCGWYLGAEFLDETGIKTDVFWGPIFSGFPVEFIRLQDRGYQFIIVLFFPFAPADIAVMVIASSSPG